MQRRGQLVRQNGRSSRILSGIALAASMVMAWPHEGVRTAAAANAAPSADFVKQTGSKLRLHGSEFRFAGSNNYYLIYKSQLMVDDVLTAAASQGFTVLRSWGSLDIGNQDDTSSVDGKKEGIYFQYWNGTRPSYNDGADGLARLDYVVYRAGQLGIKLVIPFVNNWREFGGIDQYVRWLGGQYHDQFYTDATVRGWYEDWISHVLNRVNTYTGIAYKDDPAIMTWELGNEPRCKGSGTYPTSPSCTTQTLTGWADEISRFIKRVDNKHLVSAGDEGFYCVPGSADWTENCGEGVDTIALASLPKIDVMSFHLYRTCGERMRPGGPGGSSGISPTRWPSASRGCSASSA